MRLRQLWQVFRHARYLRARHARLMRAGKYLSAFAVGCHYNNHAARFNLAKPAWLPGLPMMHFELE